MPSPSKYSRRNPTPKKKRPSTMTVPDRVGPHVKLAFAEMRRQNVTYDEVEIGSGVRRSALKAWRHKNRPNLDSIEAVLDFLGYEFVPVPTVRALPVKIVDELRPIANRMGLDLSDAIRLTAEVAYRDHQLNSIRPSV